MRKSLEKIRDIKSLINEFYQDELTEGARKSWLCFKQYCDDIKQDLEKLEKLNEIWHKNEVMESVDINANHLQELYDYIIKINTENEKLEKENQDLKDELESVHQGYNELNQTNEELNNENEGLKQMNIDLKERYKRRAETSKELNEALNEYQKVIEKFIDYLDKEPNRAIPKHSIKQTLNKLLKEVLEC